MNKLIHLVGNYVPDLDIISSWVLKNWEINSMYWKVCSRCRNCCSSLYVKMMFGWFFPNLGLVFILMLRPFTPELVMSTDLLSFELPLVLRNFQGSQVSSFDFSTLYTSLPHDLIKAKVLSLVKWCFDRESKTYLCTSAKAGFFSNKKYDSYACWTCTKLCEAFTFLMENIYVQFDGMVYQQIVGIPMGTNCAPLIADLLLYCYERDFMSNLQKSKRFDLIDKFNDTSRYLDDIFTIGNPTFAEHIPDIYPRELQLNKANTSDKETSFLDLNMMIIKVIGNDIHTSVYDKRDDFGFPIVNFTWLSGDVPRLPSYGIYILQLVRFARCCTSVFDFHSKNLQITSKLLTQAYRYHKLRKTFGKFFRSYSELSPLGRRGFKPRIRPPYPQRVVKGD